MKKIMFLFSITMFIYSMTTNAQSTWVDFGNNGEYNNLPDVNMISSSNYSVNFYGVNNYRIIVNDTAYDVMYPFYQPRLVSST
jgi:hypothetical protein